MKAIVAFLVLVIALLAVSGCTQPATAPVQTTPTPTAVQTPVPTTEAPTTVPTVEITPAPVETTVVPTPTTTPQTAITTVTIKNNVFSPATLTVLPGTGITWISEDAHVPHRVIAIGKNYGLFQSDDLDLKQTFSYTFGTVGTYEYMDSYHPTARGVIIVKEGPEIVGA